MDTQWAVSIQEDPRVLCQRNWLSYYFFVCRESPQSWALQCSLPWCNMRLWSHISMAQSSSSSTLLISIQTNWLCHHNTGDQTEDQISLWTSSAGWWWWEQSYEQAGLKSTEVSENVFSSDCQGHRTRPNTLFYWLFWSLCMHTVVTNCDPHTLKAKSGRKNPVAVIQCAVI